MESPSSLLSILLDQYFDHLIINCIFLDIGKAFGTVKHRILLRKLIQYGIKDSANTWLNSYLTSRMQFVSFGKCSSSTRKGLNRVLQGSILGPYLFLLFINDFVNCGNLFNFILYADNATWHTTSTNINSPVTNAPTASAK